MNLAAYRNYKTTEAPWLGDVPSHWEVRRLRTVLRLRNEKNSPVKTEQILSLSIAHGVTLYSHEGRGGNKRKGDITAYKIAHAGDIVLNSMNVIVGAVGLSRYTGAISPVYYALFPATDEVDIKYYDKVFGNPAFQRYLLIYGKGILIKKSNTGKLNTIRMKISPDDLKGTLLPIPPKDEQTQIARFLDWKTAQINKFIRNKRRLIELLKEQKQNVINQAVTRGLDPKVKFKPSGVEWIGDIPEHWEVRRLKFLARIRNGQDYKEVEAESGYPVMGSGGQFAYSSAFMYEGESVLFGRKGTIDKPLYINGRFWTVDTMFYTEVSKLVSAKFLYFSALSFPFDYYSTKTALPSMTQQDLGNHPVALPPRDEQELIIQYIEEESQLIDQTISRAQREMDLMREYRTRLISDVVTGQVDVRNVKCEGGSLNEDEFEDIEEVEEEIELPEGGEDDE